MARISRDEWVALTDRLGLGLYDTAALIHVKASTVFRWSVGNRRPHPCAAHLMRLAVEVPEARAWLEANQASQD